MKIMRHFGSRESVPRRADHVELLVVSRDIHDGVLVTVVSVLIWMSLKLPSAMDVVALEAAMRGIAAAQSPAVAAAMAEATVRAFAALAVTSATVMADDGDCSTVSGVTGCSASGSRSTEAHDKYEEVQVSVQTAVGFSPALKCSQNRMTSASTMNASHRWKSLVRMCSRSHRNTIVPTTATGMMIRRWWYLV